MAKKRVSMRGMGADAFFSPPSEEKEEEPVGQPTGKTDLQSPILPVGWHTSAVASQDTIIPASQCTDTAVDQIATMPVSNLPSSQIVHDTGIPARQQDSSPVTKGTSESVGQHASILVKATYYIRPDQDMKLEQIRLARRIKGEKVDKSELIREAIDKLVE
jgi:hypothetical protein